MWFLCILISFLTVNSDALKHYKRPSHLSNRPIVGGENAMISNFPHQVSLCNIVESNETIQMTRHFCGGSIIGVDWVLTAAHCVHWLESSHDVLVRVGSSLRDQGGYVHEVNCFVAHPDFTMETLNHDVALIKVSKPFEFGPNVKTIPLNKSPLMAGKVAVVSGWGTTTQGGESPLNLQKVQIPIMPQWECKWIYGKKITDNMFCAGRAGRGACHGDSGGAVVVDGHQIGIVSWGKSCELAGYSVVYVNVYKVRDWIHKNSGI